MDNNVKLIMTKNQATYLLGLLDWEHYQHPLDDEEKDIMEILKLAIGQSQPTDAPPLGSSDSESCVSEDE